MPKRQHGVRHAALREHEGRQRHDGAGERGEHAGGPAVVGPLDQPVDERAQADRGKDRAGDIEAARRRRVARLGHVALAIHTTAATSGRLMRKISRHETVWIR